MAGPEPNFFIIGAPKCGTTSLAFWLSEHPQIFFSKIKEPHFYSTDLCNRAIKKPSHYKNLFSKAQDNHVAIGEASTWYLFSKVAIENIEINHRHAKYIVMTRDPVEMARSLHLHNLWALHENEGDFERAWQLQSLRAKGMYIPKTCAEPAFLQYYQACALGTQLSKLLEKVPSVRILHISLEELSNNPTRIYKQVLSFLSLNDDMRNSFPVLNEARRYRNQYLQRAQRLGGKIRFCIGFKKGIGLSKLNQKIGKKEEISNNFRDELNTLFNRERILIENITHEFSKNFRT